MPPKKKLSGAQNRLIRAEKEAAIKSNTSNIEKFVTKKTLPSETPSHSHATENELENENNLIETEDNEDQNLAKHSTELNKTEEDLEIAMDFNNPRTWTINKNSIKMYIEHGPIYGDDAEIYPSTNNRRFEKQWFTKTMTNGERVLRKWLIYCKTLDTLFCFPCTLFCDDRRNVWVTGFNDWKHLNPSLPRHENSTIHRSNYIKMKEFEKKIKDGGFIDDNLLEVIQKEKEKWRHILKVILDAILHCLQNNDALRGTSEIIGQPDCGKFLNTIELISHYDKTIKSHIDSHNKGQVSYFSSNIQNELIKLAATKVKSFILHNIKNAKYFSILFDCTTDVAHQEQVVQIIRYVHIDSNRKCRIEESFIDFINTEEKTGEGLTKEIVDKLIEDDLNISDIRGQSYDNGANMAGKYRGVQARILSLNENARFIPCSAHSLNLVGVNAANIIPQMQTFFGTVQHIYNFFVGSTACWKLLKEELKITLKGSCDTRWSSKAHAVHALKSQLPKILTILKQIIENRQNTGDTIVKAKSIIKSIETFEFIAYLCFWDTLLTKINRINLSLQEKNLDVARGAQMISGLLSEIESYREDFFPSIVQSSKIISNDLGISPEFQQTRKRKKTKMPGEQAEDDAYLQDVETQFKTVLLQVLDSIITQINSRFVALNCVAEDFGFLNGRVIFDADITELKKMATDLAIKYNTDLDPYEFASEIESFKFQAVVLLQDFKEMGSFDLLQGIYLLSLENIYPNLVTILRIFLCMPVTTATCERSFSKLKLIKSYLRSSLGQERLANMSILCIEKETTRSLNYDEIIDLFAEAKSRKVML